MRSNETMMHWGRHPRAEWWGAVAGLAALALALGVIVVAFILGMAGVL
jgi:hypothetical protein